MCKGGGVSKFLCKYTLPTAYAGESKAEDVRCVPCPGCGDRWHSCPREIQGGTGTWGFLHTKAFPDLTSTL